MMTNSANPAFSASSASHDRFFALIPCAGQGSRAGSPLAKQYQVIAGQAMVLHTLAAFAAVLRLARTLVVVAPGDRFFEPTSERSFDVAACGGASRADSVRNGLDALIQLGASAHDWVLVHDAARCLVTPAQITQLMAACEHDEVGGLLAHKLPDTLKSELRREGWHEETQAADARVAATSNELCGSASKNRSPGATTTSVLDSCATFEKAANVCSTMAWPAITWYCLAPGDVARLPCPAQGISAKKRASKGGSTRFIVITSS